MAQQPIPAVVAASAASGSSDPPGGGLAPLLTIRTLPPLPRFETPHAVPPSDTPVSRLKLSIVRILTGAATGAASSGKTPITMTHAEQVKEMTLHGWRLQMIGLELRQNVLIAPETREKLGKQEAEELDRQMQGFELKDEHECALLEAGDEIVVRILPPFNLEDLRLPQLPANHIYRAPPASLTRVGTLSNPPSYSSINARPSRPSQAGHRSHSSNDTNRAARPRRSSNTRQLLSQQSRSHSFSTPLEDHELSDTISTIDDRHLEFLADLPHTLRRPSEPSSHSSSIAANPKANYSQHDYSRDYRNGWRVVRPGGVGNIHTVGMGTRGAMPHPDAGAPPPPRAKRHGSFGAPMTSNVLGSPSNQYAPITATLGQTPITVGSSAREEALQAAARRSSAAQHPMYAAAQAARLKERRPSQATNNTTTTTTPGSGSASPSPGVAQLKTAPAIMTEFDPKNLIPPPPTAPPAATRTSFGGASAGTPTSAAPTVTTNHTTTSGSSVTAHASGHSPVAPTFGSLQKGEPSSSSNGARQGSPAVGSTSSPRSPKLPSSALIIGPGVQGTVGRNVSSSAAPVGSSGRGELVEIANSSVASQHSIRPTNMAAFTAAEGEIMPTASSSSRKGAATSRLGRRRQASFASGLSLSGDINGDSQSAHQSLAAPGAAAAANNIGTTKSSGGSTEKRKKPLLSQLSATLARTNLLGEPVGGPKSDRNGKSRAVDDDTEVMADGHESEGPSRSVGRSLSNGKSPELPPIPIMGGITPVRTPDVHDDELEALARDAAIAAALAERDDLPPMPSAANAPVVNNGQVVQPPSDGLTNGSADQPSGRRESDAATWTDASEPEDKPVGGKAALFMPLQATLPRSKSKDGEKKKKPSVLLSDGSASRSGSGSRGLFSRKKRREGSSEPSSSTDAAGTGRTISVTASSKKTGGSRASGTSDSGDNGGRSSSRNGKAGNAANMSKFEAVQLALEQERLKQAEAEARRRTDMIRRAEKKERQRAAKEAEAKKKKVEQQWKMWEEVRKREREAGLPPPVVSDRI